VRWAHFFDVEPVGWQEESREDGRDCKPTVHMHSAALRNLRVRAYLERRERGCGRFLLC